MKSSTKNKGINVLSLFDGISCARVALERAGISVSKYYSSEIDMYANMIAKKNWPDNIYLGNVKVVRRAKVGKIDLLIGGSPCQDLSIAKANRQGLKGSKSSLFWEYVRVLRDVKPKYFILENVNSMSKEDKDTITKELGVQPIMIDAALVSAQVRKRLFWTNIPNITQPKDRRIFLSDVLFNGYSGEKARTLTATDAKGTNEKQYFTKGRRNLVFPNKEVYTERKNQAIFLYNRGKGGISTRVYSPEGKSVTLKALGGVGGAKKGLYEMLPNGTLKVKEATKKGYAIAEDGDAVDISFPTSKTRRGRVGKKAKNLMTSASISVFTKGLVRPLNITECERLQGLKDGYTGNCGVSKQEVITTLGNAFNVDVITHILKHMPCVQKKSRS